MAAAAIPSHLGARERWLTSGLLGIGLITFAILASITSLILPKLMTNLRVELSQIHWVLTAAGIARTVVIPTLGWLSGWFGPRVLYLSCLSILCCGALGSALAWDWTSMLFFRVLTGLGGGVMQPLSMAILYQIPPPSQRGMALGLSLMGWSIGPSVGAFMGGYVLELASWRAAYAMTLPVGGLGLGLAWWLLLAEASTAAWQDYLRLNAFLALLSILPAVLVSNRLWRHFRPAKTVSTVAKKHLAKRYQSH